MPIRARSYFGVALCVLTGAAALAPSSQAIAAEVAPTEADKLEARKRFDQGRRMFDLRQYIESVPEFEAAYRLSGDPAFLYNIAQSYRLADRPDEAMHYYNTFLKRDPNTPRREEVERRLQELKNAKAPPNQVSEPSGKAAEDAPAVEATVPSPPAAQPNPPQIVPMNQRVMIPTQTHRLSQGLFFQGELGLGYVGAKASDLNVALSGFGATLNLRMGAFVRPRLGLFGQISSTAVNEPSIRGAMLSGNVSGTLGFTGFGGGLLYYLPTDLFVSVAGVFQVLSYDGSGGAVSDEVGFGVSASVGKEWDLTERLSWGLVAQLQAGAVPNNDAGNGAWTTTALCIGGILTFN